jgi:hypothetical protein
MSTYRIFFTTTVSASTEVEADSYEDAVDLAYDRIPRDVCAQCGGWGASPAYSLELGGDWDAQDFHEVDAEWIEATS